MAFFLLLHGAWHGGWCWDDVADLLVGRGHRSAAPDLPIDDVTAGWDDYASVGLQALEGIEGEVVVVGHSLAGGIVPLVAAKRPVSRMVFLCSFPPEPGKSLDESLAGEPSLTDPRALAFRDSFDDQSRYVWPNLEAATYAMYHDCSSDRARDAYARLRPQATRPFGERWPLDKWPDVQTRFIVCKDDRMGGANQLRQLARRRFGIEAFELAGSHSPFISRPDDLVRALTTQSSVDESAGL